MQHYKQIFMLALTLFLTPVVSSASQVAIPEHQNIAVRELQNKVDSVLLIIQKRLAVMHEVARTKWNQKLAIEDLVREQELLAGLAEKGKNQGMDEKWVLAFFQAQFDASKRIQKDDFAIWTQSNTGRFEIVLNLKTELRPYIDQLTQDLIDALTLVYPDLQASNVQSAILTHPLSTRDTDGIDDHVWQIAILPLFKKL